MAKRKNFNIDHIHRYKRIAVKTMVFMLAVVIILFAWNGGDIWHHILKVPPAVLGLMLTASLVENTLRIYRYKIFAEELELPVPWRWMIVYYVAGMALLPTPGKVGVTLRLWLLNYHHHIPYRHSAPLLVMDVVTDTIAMMLLIGLGIAAMGHANGTMLGLVAMSGLLAAVFVILTLPKLARSGVKLLYRLTGKRWPRLFAGINALIHFLHVMMGWRVLLLCTLLSFVAWAGFGLALSGSLLLMGYDAHWLLGGFAVSLSTVLGVVSMAPAGVGGAEASLAAIIVKASQVPWETALILTLLVRTALIWIPVLIGFLTLPWALNGPEDSKKG
ncbi:MAG: flippase-like domain-containing protein [Pseudomonadaceae bacterium]|nr:flippase-like domain-containing protein [Pseudomonadaceae bacterium]